MRQKEKRITIKFRPDQLADVIEAVNAYADDLKNDRGAPVRDAARRPRNNGRAAGAGDAAAKSWRTGSCACRTKRYDGADLRAAYAADPAAVREGLPRPGTRMQCTLLQLGAL